MTCEIIPIYIYKYIPCLYNWVVLHPLYTAFITKVLVTAPLFASNFKTPPLSSLHFALFFLRMPPLPAFHHRLRHVRAVTKIRGPCYMGVSLNGGTRKSSILIGFSIMNQPSILGETHYFRKPPYMSSVLVGFFTGIFRPPPHVGFVEIPLMEEMPANHQLIW